MAKVGWGGWVGVNVWVGVDVTVDVSVGRAVQVGRGVRVMVAVGVTVAVDVGVDVERRPAEASVPDVGVRVGRTRGVGGNSSRKAMKIIKKTSSINRKAGHNVRGGREFRISDCELRMPDCGGDMMR